MTTDDTRPPLRPLCDAEYQRGLLVGTHTERTRHAEEMARLRADFIDDTNRRAGEMYDMLARHAALVAAAQALVAAHDGGDFEPYFGHPEDDPVDALRAALDTTTEEKE